MVAGTATTVGIMSQKSRLMESEGPLVKRLRQAGAILLGKTNVAQLLLYQEADNPVYGRTNNILDQDIRYTCWHSDLAEDFSCQNKGTWSRISKTTGRRQRSTVVEPCSL